MRNTKPSCFLAPTEIMSSIGGAATTDESSVEKSHTSVISSDQSRGSKLTQPDPDDFRTKYQVYQSLYTCDMMGDIYPPQCTPCESGESLVPGVLFCSISGVCPHMKYFFGSFKASLTLFEAVKDGKVVARAVSQGRLLQHLRD